MKLSAQLKILFYMIVLFLFCSTAYSGEITQPSPLPFLSFISYQTTDSKRTGDLLIRTVQVTVKNTSDRVLSIVKLSIDGHPNYVTVKNAKITIGDLNPGETVTSETTFSISVDTSKKSEKGVRIIWQVECDSNGEHLVNETAVVEYL